MAYKPKFQYLISATVGLAVISGLSISATDTNPEVWVGAPFDGNWPKNKGCDTGGENECSLPYKHWRQYGGHWSVDLPKPADAEVKLFVAPENEADNIVTKVDRISEACSSGRQGGKVLRIGVYHKGTKLGTIVYSHLNPTVSVGEVPRWGTSLGTVFTTDQNHPLCWEGAHVHMEMASEKGYSCYNRGWKPNHEIDEENFLGFLTGHRASSGRAKCP